MKLTTGLLLLASAFTASGDPVATCELQKDCISWEVSKLDADNCGVGGACAVEVCMKIDTNATDCAKDGGTISHICDMSDEYGCPYDQEGYNLPVFDYGETESNSCTGYMGRGPTDGVTKSGFTGKCNDVSQVTLCQEGKPGATLHFIIKDGNDNKKGGDKKGGDKEGGDSGIDTNYSEGGANGPLIDTANGCEATYTCQNNLYSCGNNTNQMKYERVWSYTIPDGTDCSYCDTPELPLAPSPALLADTTDAPTPETTITATAEVAPAASPNAKGKPEPGPGKPEPPSTPSGSNGDPHFKTWANEHFEYHGQCDMVLVKDKDFADGLGLDVQIRTKLVRFWSYIKSVAIRIGDDIIEIQGAAESDDIATANYWMNFEYQADLNTVGGFPVTMKVKEVNSRKRSFSIDLSSKYPGVKINVAAFREFIRVDFENHSQEAFGNAVGMLGDYKTGKTLGRDGTTEIHEFAKLGNEWQVLPVDDMLFHSTEQPQFPKKCVEPEDPQGERRRRLAESSVSETDAEAACASIKDPLDKKDCIYDIIATQDLDMAGAY